MDKPYAPACERNREPILAVLREHFADRTEVLEIGSGTGQHAVHFGAALPHLSWQCSDRASALAGIGMWLAESGLSNTPPPLEFDVGERWPDRRYDAIFSANTLHIMSWPEVERMFERLPGVMAEDCVVVIYGPFNIAGRATSDSNAAFDSMLKAQSPHRGLRDLDAVDTLARRAGLELRDDRAMPANNRCLVWQTAGS